LAAPLLAGLLLVLALLAHAAPPPGPTAPVSLELSIKLDPASRELSGSGRASVRGGEAFDLLLGAPFTLQRLLIDGKPLASAPLAEGRMQRWRIPRGAQTRQLEFAWQGRLAPLQHGLSHRDTLGADAAVAASEGSFLPAASGWYPLIARGGSPLLHAYRLRLQLPSSQRGLVPGDLVAEEDDGGHHSARFRFDLPAQGIDLMAGPYQVQRREMRSIDGRALALRTWFPRELAPLADGYLESAAGYIARYEQSIGAYPFGGFSVVASPTPTGFGMAGLTYLGAEVLRLPFIRATSLGHEVLHNWWGNGVYADYASGNWSEGLTTFMADYAYREDQGAEPAREMRLDWLRELAAVAPADEQPLVRFTARTHGPSQAIGYGRAAMLFVMLRERIGEEAFRRALRRFWQTERFRVASWNDLRTVFEAESGQDLHPWFAQWLERPGLPEPVLESALLDKGKLRVTLAQRGQPWRLDVPLRITTSAGEELHTLRLNGERKTFDLAPAAAATAVTLDPEGRMLRRLAPSEAPPVLRTLQFSPAPRLALLGEAAFRKAGQALAGRLLEHAPLPAEGSPAGTATLVIGPDSAVARWLVQHGLPARPIALGTSGEVFAWTLRDSRGGVVMAVSAKSAASLQAALRSLPHYGRQSWIVMEGGQVARKGVWPTTPARIELARPARHTQAD
jgi:hypothetical protein